MNQKKTILKIAIGALSLILAASCTAQEKPQSASYKRFRESKLKFDKYNEFNTGFKFSEITGIGYEEGVTRRDPSSVIKVGSLYYVWYSRPPANIPVVGPKAANDTLRAFHWDLSEIWYATSPDGYKWKEQGVAVNRGPKGNFDARSVFTADILVAKNKYYLYYQAAGSLKEARHNKNGISGGDFNKNKIGMSWADSPNGPWHRWEKPILEVGPEDAWDGEVVHDPSLIVKGGKYWLYYKSAGRVPWKPNISGTVFTKEFADMPNAVCGVAVADSPEGPFVKSEYNPVLIGGHEVIVWPYRNGVCAFLSEGPEANSIQFAEDGINFYPVKHGLEKPEAGGTYRVGNFTDTDSIPGKGITWGISHVLGKWNYLRRFDCDLSIEKGDKVKAEYQKVLEWKESK